MWCKGSTQAFSACRGSTSWCRFESGRPLQQAYDGFYPVILNLAGNISWVSSFTYALNEIKPTLIVFIPVTTLVSLDSSMPLAAQPKADRWHVKCACLKRNSIERDTRSNRYLNPLFITPEKPAMCEKSENINAASLRPTPRELGSKLPITEALWKEMSRRNVGVYVPPAPTHESRCSRQTRFRERRASAL